MCQIKNRTGILNIDKRFKNNYFRAFYIKNWKFNVKTSVSVPVRIIISDLRKWRKTLSQVKNNVSNGAKKIFRYWLFADYYLIGYYMKITPDGYISYNLQSNNRAFTVIYRNHFNVRKISATFIVSFELSSNFYHF